MLSKVQPGAADGTPAMSYVSKISRRIMIGLLFNAVTHILQEPDCLRDLVRELCNGDRSDLVRVVECMDDLTPRLVSGPLWISLDGGYV